MDIKEFANLLDNKQYGYPQFTDEEIAIAKENGFVIVYGASDDLIEFDGAIRDEDGCFNGGKVYICETGCVEFGNAETKCIEALWCDDEIRDELGGIITWTYRTTIPHETFMIYDDGDSYCRGIVLSIDDVK